MASGRNLKTVVNTNADPKSQLSLTWTAVDLADLQFSAITSPPTPVYFKFYTDSATFGAPVAVTALVFIDFVFALELRGIRDV
jgi:hypothetical protein